MWRKRSTPPVVPDDIEQAKAMQSSASTEHREAVTQGFAISALTAALIERRALNHFGEDISITFTPRRKNA